MAGKKEKTNMYLLAIVGIVAVVGIVILIANASSISSIPTSISLEESTIGMAYSAVDLSSCDNALVCGDDLCEKGENRTCSDCNFTRSFYCDHDGRCEPKGNPREDLTSCDDCFCRGW